MASIVTTAWRATLASATAQSLAMFGRERRDCALELTFDPVTHKVARAVVTVRPRDADWLAHTIDQQMLSAARLGARGLERHCSEAATIVLDVSDDDAFFARARRRDVERTRLPTPARKPTMRKHGR